MTPLPFFVNNNRWHTFHQNSFCDLPYIAQTTNSFIIANSIWKIRLKTARNTVADTSFDTLMGNESIWQCFRLKLLPQVNRRMMMNQKISLQQTIPLLLGLLLIGLVVILILNLNNPSAIQIAPDLSGNRPAATTEESFNYEQAAATSAMRWQAMAKFYEAQGLLTRDNFDYEQAAEIMAYRWNAMAEAYENKNLPNDSIDPNDLMAYRWQAMARAYEEMGLPDDK
jgi:hypothetical protein